MVNAIYAGYVSSYTARKGISLTRYAALLGVSMGTVERWISGQVTRPQPLHLIQLCRLHGIDPDQPEHLGFTPHTGHRSVTTAAGGHSVGLRTENDYMAAMLRRDLLSVTAGVVFGSALAEPMTRLLGAAPDIGKRVGVSDIERIRQARHRVTLGGDLLGGGTFRAQELMAEHQRATSLLRGTFATDDLRQQAHAAATTVTRQIAFEFYDLGMHDRARQLWVTALAMARDAHPSLVPVLQAHIVESMTHQAVTLGQHQQAVDLLSMISGRKRHLPPVQRSMLSAMEAFALAGLGDEDETQRLIAHAEDHLDDPADERDLEWNFDNWYHNPELDGLAGRALLSLASHNPSLSASALDRATASSATLRKELVRTKARIQTSLARLHATLGNRDEAEAAARDALHAAQGLRSPRINGELLALRPLLKRWHTHSGIAEINHEIAGLAKA